MRPCHVVLKLEDLNYISVQTLDAINQKNICNVSGSQVDKPTNKNKKHVKMKHFATMCHFTLQRCRALC